MSSESESPSSPGEEQQMLRIDERHQLLQAEQEGTQKRTFTNWINSQLSKHPRSSVLTDLFSDIQDGHKLLDLLEVLSGMDLQREKGNNVFQARSNIATALTFLEQRSIKLINIHIQDIISGKPSIVLGLIWKIILHFHIEGLAEIVADTDSGQQNKSESKVVPSPTASPPAKKSATSRWKNSARKVLLQWANERCAGHGSLSVTDFKSSWKNGLAFLAIIQSLRPEIVDMDKLKGKSNEENLQEAFRLAEQELKIPRLLEPKDVNIPNPDEKSIMTYVAQFLLYAKSAEGPKKDVQEHVSKTIEWLNSEEEKVKQLFSEMKTENYTKKYQEMLLFMRKFNEQKRNFMSGLELRSLPANEQQLIRQSLANITSQIAEWKMQLDLGLPSPLNDVESWLLKVEDLMSHKIPDTETHYNAVSLLQNASASFRELLASAASHTQMLQTFNNVDDNGFVLVPTDKIEEMKIRLEKITDADFSLMLDYRCSGHFILALLDEGRPKLKTWSTKCKTQGMAESLLADWKEFIEEMDFLIRLQAAFQNFVEIKDKLLAMYTDDSEISKDFEMINMKYREFVNLIHLASSNLENLLLTWTHYENNISLITGWLDEQERIAPTKVPAEILSKWKSVHASLNTDATFLKERVHEKTALKVSAELKYVNTKWTKFVKRQEKIKPKVDGKATNLGPSASKHEKKLTEPLLISADSLRIYIENMQGVKENDALQPVCNQICSRVERIESIIYSAEQWPSTAETFFLSTDQLKLMDGSLTNDLQDLCAQGAKCQEQISEAEKEMKAVQQIILSHDELKHFNTNGIQEKLALITQKVQMLMSRLSDALASPELHLSESDIKNKFESSKGKLETYITTAMCLMRQRITPEEFISQYENTLDRFDNENLDDFLKVADQMKSISASQEKSAVDKVSVDLRSQWKIIHTEMESYVFRLKLHLEKKKFDDLFCEAEEKLRFEEEHVDLGDREDLIRQHKRVFSEDGCLSQLCRCLQAMKLLLATPRNTEDNSAAQAIISECVRKKAEIEKRSGNIYLHLLTPHGMTKNENNSVGLENGLKSETSKSAGAYMPQEIGEAVLEHHNGGWIPYEENNANLSLVLQRYDQEKSKLEQFLHSCRKTITADNFMDGQDLSSLHTRLHELEILQFQANIYWRRFETLSCDAEKLLDIPQTSILNEKRAELQSNMETLKEELQSSVQLLSVTLNVLLPMQSNKSDEELEKFTLSNIDSACQELKDARDAVEDHLQKFDILESASESGKQLNHVALEAVQSIKTELEATCETMREKEAILKALERFFSSLEATKVSIVAQANVWGRDKAALEEKQKNLTALENEICHLNQEALQLDGRLQEVEISLEDPEHGGDTSCQKLIAGFPDKVESAKQAVLQELSNLHQRVGTGADVVLPVQNEVALKCETSQLSEDQTMQQITLLNMDSVLQEIKDVKSSVVDEIRKCEDLQASAELNEDLSPADLQEFHSTLHDFKANLKETNKDVKERETALKALKRFLFSLKTTKLNIEEQFIVMERDRTALQDKQTNLTVLEKKIYQLEKEAQLLDGSLEMAGVYLEDPESGGKTSCQLLIAGFSERVESAKENILQELRNLQWREDLEKLAVRQKELCKCVQDIYDKVDQIGLSDPTIHSVKQRLKHLNDLEKELDSHVNEKRNISEGLTELLQIAQGKDFIGDEESEILWEDTRQYIIYCKEQCEKVMELLRKFQKCKATLSSLIHKGEITVAQQSSYMGKENVQKKLNEVEVVKEEFTERSEDIDELSSICKELQFHLSKMKGCGNPPFQDESHMIVDKWLDVNEKLDSYSDNLQSASCLWNKILQLSEDIDQWAECKIKYCEGSELTKDDVLSLKAELQLHEEKIEAFSTKSSQVQKILESCDPPLELQVIKTSLLKKMEQIHTFSAREPGGGSHGSQLEENLGANESNEIGVPHSNGLFLETDLMNLDKTEDFESLDTEDGKFQDQEANVQKYAMSSDTTAVLNRATKCEAPVQHKGIESLRLQLSDLMKRKEYLFSNLQPGLQEKVQQLESFIQFLQEVEDFTDTLAELKAKDATAALHSGVNEWRDMEYVHRNLIKQLQDTRQILENQVHRHEQYEILTDTLNSKMARFSQELLNFTSSSWESAAGEQKRQKLQALKVWFGEMDTDLMQVLELAEQVKQSTSAPGVKGIQEATRTLRNTIEDLKEKLQSLKHDKSSSLSAKSMKPLSKEIPRAQVAQETVLPIQSDSVTVPKVGRGRKKKKLLAEHAPKEPEESVKVEVSVSGQRSTDATKQKDQTIPVMLGSSDSGFKQTEEFFKNLMEWLQNSRINLQMYKNSQCDEERLSEKIGTVQNMCDEIVQKKIDLRATDKKSEKLETKSLKESEEVGRWRQEVTGQLESLLLDCDSYKGQLETSLTALTVCANEFHVISSLLNTVDEKLISSESIPGDNEKAVLLHEIQPLYEDVKDYIGRLDQAYNQAVCQNITCRDSNGRKHLNKKFKLVTKKMMSFSKPDDTELKLKGDSVQNGESCVRRKTLKKKQTRSSKKKTDNRPTESGNLLPSDEMAAQQPVSLQAEDGTTTQDLIPLNEQYRKNLEDILSKIEVFNSDSEKEHSPPKETTVEWLVHQSKLHLTGKGVKQQRDDNQEPSDIADVQRKVSFLKKQPVGVDVLETEWQVQEIKKLCDILRPPLMEETSTDQFETISASSLNVESRREGLLSDLKTLWTQKQKDAQSIKEFQNALSAAKQSLQVLLKEKDNLKMGPTESLSNHLDKINDLMAKVVKEKEKVHNLLSAFPDMCCLGISSMDKEKLDSEMKQLGQDWEQTEITLQKKQDILIKESDELTFLKKRITQVEQMIQAQQEAVGPFAKECLHTSLFLAADLQTTKHLLASLRNAYDVQMKRSCVQYDSASLESSICELQNQLDKLETCTSNCQITLSGIPGLLVDQYPFVEPLYFALLWVKKSHSDAKLDHNIPLLPEAVEQQVIDCNTLQEKIVDKKTTVDSGIEELTPILSGMDAPVSEALSSFFHQLQLLYQERYMLSVERLQQLQNGLQKRKTLFSEIEKLKELLQYLEKEAALVKKGIFTASELCEQLTCLKARITQCEEIEGLALTLLRSSQNLYGELQMAEQLYLNDILRSLKSRANRIRRLEERKISYIEKVLTIFNEFQEKTSLGQELNSVQGLELHLLNNETESTGENSGSIVEIAQNAVPLYEDHLSEISRYKELFEDNGLQWDNSTVSKLQSKFSSFAKKPVGRKKPSEAEQIEYSELLEKIKIMTFSVQREIASVLSGFDIVEAQVACAKITKITNFISEAVSALHLQMPPNVQVTHLEEQKLNGLNENLNQLHEYICQHIADMQRESRKNGNSQLPLSNLRKIDKELQQPLKIKLDIYRTQELMTRFETLKKISKSEVNDIRSNVQPNTNVQLHELDGIEKSIEENVSLRINMVQDACNTLQKLHDTITKVLELFIQFETQLRDTSVDLTALLDGSELKNALTSKEDLKSLITEIQKLSNQPKISFSPDEKKLLDNIMGELITRDALLTTLYDRRKTYLESCQEKYLIYKERSKKISNDLKEAETVISDSYSQKPVSYKEALVCWERGKVLVAKLYTCEEELLNLRHEARELGSILKSSDFLFIEKAVMALWDKWLYLLDVAQNWELHCEEQRQEWKLISEQMEREMILLDNFQEETPDKIEKKEDTRHILDSVQEFKHFMENLNMQQLQLSLLMSRIKNIQSTSENTGETEPIPVIQEIQSMTKKCEKLQHKASVKERDLRTELQERKRVKEDIASIRKSVQETSSAIQSIETTDAAEKREQLQKLQTSIDSEGEKLNSFMEKLRIQYCGTVPDELSSLVEECQDYLEETEEKVKIEVAQSSPYYIMTKKVEEITSGLKSIEILLSQKSENISKAKDLEKKMWDEMDVWRGKLNALESEVHDMGEEDPSLMQEWMDNLTEPFNQCQQVSYLVERRTASLNKATSKLEEYEEILKSMEFWIQNTDKLLNEEIKNCSAKFLSKHVAALEMALDDSDQRQSILGNIHNELGELSVIFETDSTAKRLSEISSQVTELQKRIVAILPHIQFVADELDAIEGTLKTIAKKTETIKTILTSNDIVDMSPKEHYNNGKVILENIESMKKTVANIDDYKPNMMLKDAGVHSLSAFRKTGQFMKELQVLEKATREQNLLLEPIITEMTELEKEQEKFKHFPKHSSTEAMDIKEKCETIKEKLDGLNQKKEEVLSLSRSLISEQLEHLLLEQQQQEMAAESSTVPEEANTSSSEALHNQAKRTDYFVLPSVVEEAEEVSFSTEEEENKPVPSQQDDLMESEDTSESNNIQLPSFGFSQGEESKTSTGKQKDLEMILCECQRRATEVELWLQRLNLSLETSKQVSEMQQIVEQQLADCQNTLQEIEKKICTMLEGDRHRNQGNGAMFKEAETLSLKLTTLKSCLENVQAMLQAKTTIGEVQNEVNMSLKIKEAIQLEEQRGPEPDSTDISRVSGIELPTSKEVPGETHQWDKVVSEQVIMGSPSRSQSVEQVSEINAAPDSNIPIYSLEGVSWSKWRYLQKQLSYRIDDVNKSVSAKEVKISIAPRFSLTRTKLPVTEELNNITIQLKSLAKEVSVLSNQEKESYLLKTLFSWLYASAQWLQNTDEILAREMFSKEEAVSQQVLCEKLTEELDTLQAAMANNKEALLQPVAHNDECTAVISQCYNNMWAWLLQTRSAAESKVKCIQTELEKHSLYPNDIQQLYESLLEIKSEILKESRNAGQTSEQLQKSVTYESELKNFEGQLPLLKEKGETLSVPVALNQEIHKVEEVLNDTWRILRAKQEEWTSASVNKSQWNALRCGIVDLLEVGKEKLSSSKAHRPTSKEALTSQLEKYRNFFNMLENQVILVQMYFSTAPQEELSKDIQGSIVFDSISLQEEAEPHGIQIKSTLRDWRDFDLRYDHFNKELENLIYLVPAIGLVEESEERVAERIHQYQHIKIHIEDVESRLCQVIADGKKLITVVNCPELETQIKKLEKQWSQLTQKVTHELHRLESLLRHLGSYNRNSAELSVWFESAHQRLNSWKLQSLDASQDLETVKNNLTSLFEFTNEVDRKSSLKTLVLNTGSQLLRLKESDTAVLKVSLANFEEKWGELIAGLPVVQEKLQQLLMEKLPSREAIYELMVWMDKAEYTKEPVDGEKAQKSVSRVRSLLQECKDFKKEMNHKQCIVDFVNQSLLQLSAGDVESKRYEKTEFAESLGTMNLQWHQMHGDLSRKIQQLEHTLEIITVKENEMKALNNWFDAQQQRLEKLKRPISMSAVECTLADCKDMVEQLVLKSSAAENLKKDLELMGIDDHSQKESGVVTETLLKKRDSFASQVAEVKSHITSTLQHWKTFDENYEDLNKLTVKLIYILGQNKPSVSSQPILQNRLKRLQSLLEEVEQQEEKWIKLRLSLDSMADLCSPSVVAILQEKQLEAHARWDAAHQELACHIQAAQILLQLWEQYHNSYLEHTQKLEQLEEKCSELVYGKISEDKETDTLQQRIQDLQEFKQALRELRSHVIQVSEMADKVLEQDPAASDIILSERSRSSQRIAALERRAASRSAELTLIMNDVKAFKENLETIQAQVQSSANIVGTMCLSGKEREEKSEVIKLLELSELSSDIEHLNEESYALPFDDATLKLLLNLNSLWTKTTESALEECREHQMNQLEKKNFVQNYETWLHSIEKLEDSLTGGIARTFVELKQQQHNYERLLAEIAINEHILPCFVRKALALLEAGEEENSSELILKLTALTEKWQNVISLVHQRKRGIDALIGQWCFFNCSRERLRSSLTEIQADMASVSSEKCHSLFQIRKLTHDFKSKELHLSRWKNIYSTALDHGKDLISVAQPESKNALKHDVTQLQEQWESTKKQLQTILNRNTATLQKWQSFAWTVEDRRNNLHEQKLRVNEPIPTLLEELQKAKESIKELEKSLAEWKLNLRELSNMKSDLSQCILADDGVVLKKQIEAVHVQWEELCLRVSVRKQEIEDRLNAWNVFNEKNKELCEWLTQMESKVLQTADVNIEEMIEKLQKDCMEEINLFSENKQHLKQIGDQLIIASNKARATEIDNKLNKINDRWQHLFDIINSRVKKLKETLVIIQQLDKNMSNLRTWLAQIESELSKPVIYSICDDKEIQNKLSEQQDLHKDIELQSAGVASVLNICERLLHDTDACANETECDSIQQTTRSLDKRWRNICAMSMERRLRIEETWRLWQKFLEDYSRYEEWLKEAEATAASPESSEVLYTRAKEEQKKFEAFQRQIHERLTHLELVNKQYRRLARENRTDAASKLKHMVHQGNQRWDILQKRVAAILKRLKHFTSQREEFEGTRESIIVWLTEMDLQLTNVEHFSESDIEEKMRQLNEFQQQITLNINKIDDLILSGEHLIQKSQMMDAVVIEEEIEELLKYRQEVFGRVSRFHQRLTSRNRLLDEERETSENDTDAEDSREMPNSPWHSAIHGAETSHPSICHLMPPTLPHERSGRETPVSVDSIPLEWDHTGDVGGSSSHEDDEEGTYFTALSDVEIPESPEAYLIMTTKSVQESSGQPDVKVTSWHSPVKRRTHRKHSEREHEKGPRTATTGTNTTFDLANSVVMPSTAGIEDCQHTESCTGNEQLKDQGLLGTASPETYTGVIERWEIIQAQSLSDELRMKQSLQQWQQFNSDLNDITLWLDKMETDLDGMSKVKSACTIQELEQKVLKLKDTLREFDNFKALVISANLSCKELQPENESESGDVLNRLHGVNLRWDNACHKRDEWRESLQGELMQCEEFHETADELLHSLAKKEEIRLRNQVTDFTVDPDVLLERQKELLQLEHHLLELQGQVNTLQDISSCLLNKTAADEHTEAEEKVHVVGMKVKQLLKGVSQELQTVQQALDYSPHHGIDTLDSIPSESYAEVEAASKSTVRTTEQSRTVQEVPRNRSLFYRVLRAAFPFQLLLLLLLLLACMIPFSEEDFSCAHANNFARSFYPMLRYTNGPPPT
ncbi:nesprin-2-like isoform X2 [Xenopus laevis]|uniref:Nesprin-2-like isoform X2 n=1 Tax=Xenopus laevis TaxID=8355 RepID=A0A8J0TCE3_XENLA|nr:nesprin-2-like isoform X2 [Xenopus laevis]